MIFEKNRWEIWNLTQHPYKHSLAEFSYVNPALPNVVNVEQALNYILAVLYPNTKPNVPDVASLPASGNTIGDYRVVDDDGDGKSAGYRWEQREGDATPQWYKIFDVDWSTDAILAAVTDVTDFKYVYKSGKTDLDELGDPIVGLYAGQTVYGGDQANQNLTLNANSGDGLGPQTGFVQIDSQFRPTVDDTFDLSTATERWRNLFLSNSVVINTMTISSGSIVDSTGTIDFDDEILNTTGNIFGATITGSQLVADDTINSVTLVPGSYTDSTGAVDFGSANLLTTGTLGASVATLTENTHTLVFDPDNGSGRATITSSQGNIDFDNENLYTTGSLNVGAIVSTQLDVDNLRLDGNTISSTNTDGNIIIVPDGTGQVYIQKTLDTLDINTNGILSITGQADIDNVRIDGNTVTVSDLNGTLILAPNGSGRIQFNSTLLPSAGGFDIGSGSALLNDIYLSGGIRNAANEIAITTLLAFRSGVWRDLAQTQPAQSGDALFYDSVNGVWLASTPDSEVDHATISSLTIGDAGHTQFVMLAGRVGGQVIQGGTGASNNLVLESTSNVTKGSIFVRDNVSPETNASYSGSWSGTDLGDGTHYFRDVYTKGEFKGLRLENTTSGSLPSASVQNIGRLLFATDNNKAYVDTGTQMKVLGVAKFSADQAFDGVQLTKDIDVSLEIQDARQAQFVLLDNANDFEILYVSIKATSASNVRITTTIPLPVGSYRLIGIE